MGWWEAVSRLDVFSLCGGVVADSQKNRQRAHTVIVLLLFVVCYFNMNIKYSLFIDKK